MWWNRNRTDALAPKTLRYNALTKVIRSFMISNVIVLIISFIIIII